MSSTDRSRDSQATLACCTRCRSREIACTSAVNAEGRLSGRHRLCSCRRLSASTNASKVSDFDGDNRYRSLARAEIFGDTQNTVTAGNVCRNSTNRPSARSIATNTSASNLASWSAKQFRPATSCMIRCCSSSAPLLSRTQSW